MLQVLAQSEPPSCPIVHPKHQICHRRTLSFTLSGGSTSHAAQCLPWASMNLALAEFSGWLVASICPGLLESMTVEMIQRSMTSFLCQQSLYDDNSRGRAVSFLNRNCSRQTCQLGFRNVSFFGAWRSGLQPRQTSEIFRRSRGKAKLFFWQPHR